MKKCIYIFLGLLMAVTAAMAQDDIIKEENGEPIKLVHADSLRGFNENGRMVRQCDGNVVITQGNVKVTSDHALQYLDENSAVFTGNVKITQEDLLLESPKINYYGATGLASAFNGVKITDKKGTLVADSGNYSTRTFIADFLGHVRVSDDSVNIFADTIQYHRKTRVSYAYGDVKIIQDSVNIYANMAEYHRMSRMSFAYGNVEIEEDSVLIFADTLKNDRNDRITFAHGNVLVRGRYDNVLMASDTIVNRANDNYTFAVGAPVLYKIDTVRKSDNDSSKIVTTTFTLDTLSVASDTMKVYRDKNERYIFINNVEVYRKDVAAKAGYAIYFRNKEMISMRTEPVVWYDSTQLYGDSIIVYIPGNSLELIKSMKNALAATRNDTIDLRRIDQIVGDEIKIVFREDTIRNISAFNNTKSLYYIVSDGSNDGAKRDGADTMLITFAGGEPEKVIWLGSVDGEVYSENLIYDKPDDIYLPNFRWVSERPDKIDLEHRHARYIPVVMNIMNISADLTNDLITIQMEGYAEGDYHLIIKGPEGDIILQEDVKVSSDGMLGKKFFVEGLVAGNYEYDLTKDGKTYNNGKFTVDN